MVSQQNSDPPVTILFFVSKLVSVCFLVHSKYFFLLISYEETGPQNLFVYHVTIFIVLLFHSDSQNRLSSVLENNRELCTALGMMRFKLIIYFVIHVITEDGFAELAFATWGEGNFCPSPKRSPPHRRSNGSKKPPFFFNRKAAEYSYTLLGTFLSDTMS